MHFYWIFAMSESMQAVKIPSCFPPMQTPHSFLVFSLKEVLMHFPDKWEMTNSRSSKENPEDCHTDPSNKCSLVMLSQVFLGTYHTSWWHIKPTGHDHITLPLTHSLPNFSFRRRWRRTRQCQGLFQILARRSRPCPGLSPGLLCTKHILQPLLNYLPSPSYPFFILN